MLRTHLFVDHLHISLAHRTIDIVASIFKAHQNCRKVMDICLSFVRYHTEQFTVVRSLTRRYGVTPLHQPKCSTLAVVVADFEETQTFFVQHNGNNIGVIQLTIAISAEPTESSESGEGNPWQRINSLHRPIHHVHKHQIPIRHAQHQCIVTHKLRQSNQWLRIIRC